MMGISLSVNAWLITRSVDEMTLSVKQLNKTMADLSLAQAVTTDRVQLQQAWLQSNQERIRSLEGKISNIEGQLVPRNKR